MGSTVTEGEQSQVAARGFDSPRLHQEREEAMTNIPEAILDHYGIDSQVAKTLEELSELSEALQRWVLTQDSEPVIDEVADVSLMLDQLTLHFGSEAVIKRKRYKEARQLVRIDRELLEEMGAVNG